MADTTNIGLRIPDDLLKEVDALKDEQGISRTEAIISLIQKGLGHSQPETNQASPDVLGRLDALEKKLLS